MAGIPDINAEQNNLIHQEIPVRFRPDGKVSSEWRNTGKENRHQTQDILRKITSLENLAEACKKRLVIFGYYSKLHSNPL